jgi:hypothetical protein
MKTSNTSQIMQDSHILIAPIPNLKKKILKPKRNGHRQKVQKFNSINTSAREISLRDQSPPFMS